MSYQVAAVPHSRAVTSPSATNRLPALFLLGALALTIVTQERSQQVTLVLAPLFLFGRRIAARERSK